jgi:hypothetical protein
MVGSSLSQIPKSVNSAVYARPLTGAPGLDLLSPLLRPRMPIRSFTASGSVGVLR